MTNPTVMILLVALAVAAGKHKSHALLGCLLGCLLLAGCHPKSCLLEPCITFCPPQRLIEPLPSAFAPLSPQEFANEWGKELRIAEAFGRELDLYRAITAYKRAKILIPRNHLRLSQIEYGIVECYYLGQKYQDAVEAFESSSLTSATSSSFPAFRELLLLLYDAYGQIGQEEKAEQLLEVIEKCDAGTATNLKLFTAFNEGDLPSIISISSDLSDNESYDLFFF